MEGSLRVDNLPLYDSEYDFYLNYSSDYLQLTNKELEVYNSCFERDEITVDARFLERLLEDIAESRTVNDILLDKLLEMRPERRRLLK